MVVPAKAVFRPSGFFLNLAVRNANGLGNLTRLAVAFSVRGHFEGRYKAKGSRQIGPQTVGPNLPRTKEKKSMTRVWIFGQRYSKLY